MSPEAMTDRRIAKCLVCEADQLRPVRGYEKDHVVRCGRCGFEFAAQRPTQAELDVVYARYTRRYERTEATLRKMQATADTIAALSGARRVLDIACGDGTFASMFQGCEVYGTEYDAAVEALARNKGVHMLPGGILPDGGPQLAGTLDLVILTEVIEHLNNPQEVLANISRLLRPTGYLYLTTPNFGSLERQVIGPSWSMICYPEHIAYWSPRTLDFFLRRHGYERVFNRTENVSLFRIIHFLNERLGRTSPEKALDATQISDLAQDVLNQNRLLGAVKTGVNHGLRLTGLGTSLLAMYRKTAGHVGA